MVDPFHGHLNLYGGKRHHDREEVDGGSPWRAMKRLRVAEDGTLASAFVQPLPSDVDQWTPAATTTSNTGIVTLHRHQEQHIEDREQVTTYRQDAGQDTMSEGTPTPRKTMQRDFPPPSCASTIGSSSDGDVDYHSVNHILGALHLGRRRRGPIHNQQQVQQPLEFSSEPRHDEHMASAPTPPPWSYDRAMSTPPPKPTKRRVVNLSTNSKLG